MSFVQPLNKKDFEELLKTTTTYLLIDFYADWCAPCMRMMPIIESIAQDEEMLGKITFYKVNADFEQELSEQFQVRGIPAFFLVQTDGTGTLNIVKNWVGSQDPFKLKSDILMSINTKDTDTKTV
jgi:thioredoxin-like negative regulator of GroEL